MNAPFPLRPTPGRDMASVETDLGLSVGEGMVRGSVDVRRSGGAVG
eukprot:CAMPEP_0183317250 /NCGR_PEP_ID=MMETSP0160_2-20130417/57399_1 /TAXON_ID=2839 ORGANISM="Odontella Sinensis, Strain Grunow 1884" /NCGR_SAMPLE_ID=MMETSP0160_2 /ASSEMBLY_ACC=CAM_ASM_000250 /LENGTH=45 /DNA_ID= /DNA_START= /DNA_END= /DNA_ORIENTATION=